MTLQQFNLCRRQYRRFALLAGLLWSVALLAVGWPMSRWESDHESWPRGLWLALNISVALSFSALVFLSVFMDSKVVSRVGLRCPACKRHLASTAAEVAATGRCRCGEQIVSDSDHAI